MASVQFRDLMDLCAVELPEMSGNGWAVVRVECTEAAAKFDRMRSIISGGGRGRHARPGTYTQLWQVRRREGAAGSWRELWMSDTPDERRDHGPLFAHARGSVLVHGLGLGMLIRPLLSLPEVAHLTIVEIDAGLIDLIGPWYRERWGDRLSIICGDALTWTPPAGARWGAVWHDIWPSICADNLPQMRTLHRRFGRRCGWQGSWARHLCEE